MTTEERGFSSYITELSTSSSSITLESGSYTHRTRFCSSFIIINFYSKLGICTKSNHCDITINCRSKRRCKIKTKLENTINIFEDNNFFVLLKYLS